MKRILQMAVIGFCAAFAGQAAAAEQYLAFVSDDHMAFVEISSIMADGDLATAKVLRIYTEPKPFMGKTNLQFIASTDQFDCKTNRVRTLEARGLDRDGQVLHTLTKSSEVWREMEPETAGGSILVVVCHPADRDPSLIVSADQDQLMQRAAEAGFGEE